MAIIPHVLGSNEAFETELKNFFISVEANRELVYADIKGVPTIGIGYTLVQRINGVWQIRPNLNNQILNATGITISEADNQILQNIANALNEGDIEEASNLANTSDFSFEPITSDQAKNLLVYVIPEYADELKRRIGDTVYNSLANSKEMIALLSIVYQGWGTAIKQPLIDALQNDNRAESWYQIRYAMNTARADWMANRRYKEADEFSLYNYGAYSGSLTPEEAKEVMRMYTIHKTEIYDYERTYSPPLSQNILSIDNEILLAKDYLISNFAQGRTINGEIIIGKGLDSYSYTSDEKNNPDDAVLLGTANNDLIFGEKGDDGIIGMDGNDVIYGGEGNDQIIGGKGNDIMEGGEGIDTYYYRAGDGSDWINDTGNNNVIIEKADGTKQKITNFYETGDNVWTTADGKIEITHHSPWQIVLEDGSTLTLGENFQDGDFGIHLKDVPENPVLLIV